MRFTAVVNPGAGRRGAARERARLDDALRARGVTVCTTATAAEGRDAAAAAFARGEGVIACGGDGTVRALAEVAASADGLLAVAPTGAGNDFARALGIDPTRTIDALTVLDHGVEDRVDLGRVTTADGATVVFTTVAHSGLDAEVNRWANTVTWLSGTALYAVAALRTMAVYRPTAMRITVDGEEWSGRPWLVAVANTYCYGGGMRIAPDARIDDGLLEVVVVHGVSRPELMWKFPRVLRGTHVGVEGVRITRGRVVEIDGPDVQDCYASGERVGPVPALVEVLPQALRVLRPDSPTR